MSEDIVRAGSEAQLCEIIAEAREKGACLTIRSGGSKDGVGRPSPHARVCEVGAIAGVVDYDPAELIMTARPGTPLQEITDLVAGQGQMLAFEPFDHGPIFGREPGAATLGGVVASGVAGSQRLSSGGARDHLLGVRAVSGRGESFVSGAKVVKNVTGYDLPKLMAGSWGRLAVLTELTLKVLPAPRVAMTLALAGLDASVAVAAMGEAMGSTADVAATAHLPGDPALTVFRLQGFQASVRARRDTLAVRLKAFGALSDVSEDAGAIWASLRTLAPLAGPDPLWRINVAPRQGAAIATSMERLGARWLLDWAGGLVWVATQADPMAVRQAAQAAGGHAQLWRAQEAMRIAVPALHPPSPGLAMLETRVRRAFDPDGVFETGRF